MKNLLLHLLVLQFICIFGSSNAQSIYINDNCTTAEKLVVSKEYSLNLKIVNIDNIICNTPYEPQLKGVWYDYDGDGKILSIQSNNNYNFTFKVFEGQCENLVCLNLYNDQKFLTKAGKKYKIFVGRNLNDFSNQSSNFSIKSYESELYSDCATAPILKCDESLSIKSNVLFYNPKYNSFFNGQQFAFIKINGDGLDKTLNINSDIYYYSKIVFFEENCNTINKKSEVYGQRSISYTSTPGINVLVGISVGGGDFNISLNCNTSTSTTNICTNAELIDCNATINKPITNTILGDLNSGSLPGYWFKTKQGKIKHQINLNQRVLINGGIKVYTSRKDNCTDLVELANFTGYNSQQVYTFNTSANESLYFKVFGASGEVDFEYTCSTNVDENTSYKNAKSLLCKQEIEVYNLNEKYDQVCNSFGRSGLWYKLESQPQIYEFESIEGSVDVDVRGSVYKLIKDSLICVENIDLSLSRGSKQSIKSNGTEQYFLKLFTNTDYFKPIKLSITCVTPEDNSFCEKAEVVRCDSIYSIPFTNQVHSINDKTSRINKGKWFKIYGDGRTYSLLSANPFDFYNYDIYVGECNNIQRLYNYDFSSYIPSQKIKTEIGKVYYFRIYNTNNSPILYLSFNCAQPAVNQSCFNAREIKCKGDTVSIFNVETNVTNSPCDTSSGEWLKFIGADKLNNFRTNNYTQFTLFEGGCGNLRCIISSNNNLNFFGRKNKEYFIKVANYSNNPSSIFISCQDIEENSCSNPRKMVCGDNLELNFSKLPNAPQIDEYPTPIRDFWVEIEGDGKTYNFKPPFPGTSFDLDYELYVNNCSQITLGNRFMGNNSWMSNISLPTEVGIKYLIRFTSEIPNNFISLSLNCAETPPNQICSQALPINCGQEYNYSPKDRISLFTVSNHKVRSAWYSIEGNDVLTKIKANGNGQFIYNVYESDSKSCGDSLKAIEQTFVGNGIGNFYLKKGKTYFIEFWTPVEASEDFNVNFTLDCEEIVLADNCESALSLNCNQSYNLTNIGADQNKFGACSNDARGIWLKLIGNGQLMNLAFQPSDYFLNDLYVFLGTGLCDSINCLDVFDINYGKSNLTFLSENGKSYFIKLQSKSTFNKIKTKLFVSCSDLSTNSSCQKSIPFICGSEISGNTTFLPSDIDNPCKNDKPGLYYNFVGNGESWVFTDNSPFTNTLNIDIMQNDCKGNGRCLFQRSISQYNKSFVLQTRKGISYHLKVYHENTDNTAPFSLKTECVSASENINCQNASDLNCNTFDTIQLITPLGHKSNTACGSYSTGLGHWYRLPKTDKLMEINLVNIENYYVELVKGVCNQFQCIGNYRPYQGKIILDNKEEEEMYLVIYAENNDYREVFLNIKCLDRIENDDCTSPKLLQCGDNLTTDVIYATYDYRTNPCNQTYGDKDIWFEVKGDNSNFKLSFSNNKGSFSGGVNLYEKGNCFSLSCLDSKFINNFNQDQSYVFKTEANKSYLIQIVTTSNFDNTPFNISTSCESPAKNDDCEQAITVYPDQQVVLDFTGATKDINKNCLSGENNTIWYKLIGNDSLILIEGVNQIPDLNLYIFSSCYDSDCSNGYSIRYDGYAKFLAEKGKEYYLAFSGNTSTIKLSSIFYQKNSKCSQATPIRCGDSMTLNHINYFNNIVESYCHNSNETSGWFEVMGTGQNIRFDITNSSAYGNVRVLTQCLGECLYTHDIIEGIASYFTLETEKGKKYLLKVSLNKLPLGSKTLSIKASCVAGKNNSSIATAEALECGLIEIEPEKRAATVEWGCRGYKREYFYKFKGNGQSMILNKGETPFDVEILDTFCQVLHHFTTTDSSFITKDGQDYLLIFAHNRNYIPNGKYGFYVDYGCASKLTSLEEYIDEFKAYPNPFSHNLAINFSSLVSGDVTIDILDSTGKLVSKLNSKISSGQNTIELEENKFSTAGIYHIRIKSAFGTKNFKVLKIE